MVVVALEVMGLAVGALLLARVRRVPALTDASAASIAATTVSVIIPARDEETALPHLLASLAAQRWPAHEVIVVDDGSSDRTAAVAAAAGALVIPAGALPPGWLGKPWACWVGAQHASGTTLVFLDADATLRDDALARLVHAQRAFAPDGLLSVQPHHRVRRPHEQLSAFPNVVSMMGTGQFGAWSPRRRATSAMAFGPCLITARDVYGSVGGHASVRGRVVEDVHLARAYAAAGRTVRCLAGGDAVAFRMYPSGLGALVEGWTKNLAEGSRRAPVGPAIGAVAWVGACAAAAVGTVAAGVAWATGGPMGWWPLAWLVVSAELWWMLARIGTFRWWTWIAFPLPLAAFLGLFLWSSVLRLGRRPVRWRGRLLQQVPHR